MLLEGAKCLRGHRLQGKRGRRHQRICECSSNPHRSGFSPAGPLSFSVVVGLRTKTCDLAANPGPFLQCCVQTLRAGFLSFRRWVCSVHENSTGT